MVSPILPCPKGNEQFMKFNKIARHAWDILQAAANLPDNKRVYILSHNRP